MPNSINTLSPDFRDFLLLKNLVADSIVENGLSSLLNGVGYPAPIDTQPISVQQGQGVSGPGEIFQQDNTILNRYQGGVNDYNQVNIIYNNSSITNQTGPYSFSQINIANIGNIFRPENTQFNLYNDEDKQTLVNLNTVSIPTVDNFTSYLDENGNLNIGGPSTQALDIISGVLNGQGVGFNVTDGTFISNGDIRATLGGRILGAAGIINDTKLGKIGAQQLLTHVGYNAAFGLQQETLGNINLNPLTLLQGAPLVTLNYQITTPKNTVGKVLNFAANIFGVQSPLSLLQDSIFSFDDKGIFIGNENIKMANEMIKNSGRGQVNSLFNNLRANTRIDTNIDGGVLRQGYAPGYEDDRGGANDGINPQIYARTNGDGKLIDFINGATNNPISSGNYERSKQIFDDGWNKDYIDKPHFNTPKGIMYKDAYGWQGPNIANKDDIPNSGGDSNAIGLGDLFTNPTQTDRKTLLFKTQQLFNTGLMRTMVSGHGDIPAEGRSQINSAVSNVGGYTSKGSGVMSSSAVIDNVNNGPENVFCRTWTTYDRYAQVKDLQKSSALGTVYNDYDRLNTFSSVLDDNGFVKITPYSNVGDDDVKNYMFSIENLAWGDDLNNLLPCEIGPGDPVSGLRGRIMWFPPYDISFTETTTASWDKQNFIGRGEPMFTYNNTERTGTLQWKIIIDHPNYINLFNNDNRVNNDFIASFFAGCLSLEQMAPFLTQRELDAAIIENQPEKEEKVDEPITPPTTFNVYFPNDTASVEGVYEGYEDGLCGGVSPNIIIEPLKDLYDDGSVEDYYTYSLDGSMILVPTKAKDESSITIKIYDAESGDELVFTHQATDVDGILGTIFSPDNTRVLYYGFLKNFNGFARMLDIDTGDELFTVTETLSSSSQTVPLPNTSHASFSPEFEISANFIYDNNKVVEIQYVDGFTETLYPPSNPDYLDTPGTYNWFLNDYESYQGLYNDLNSTGYFTNLPFTVGVGYPTIETAISVLGDLNDFNEFNFYDCELGFNDGETLSRFNEYNNMVSLGYISLMPFNVHIPYSTSGFEVLNSGTTPPFISEFTYYADVLNINEQVILDAYNSLYAPPLLPPNDYPWVEFLIFSGVDGNHFVPHCWKLNQGGGSRFLTVSKDNKLRIWNSFNGDLLHEYPVEVSRFSPAFFNSDGTSIFTRRVIDENNGEPIELRAIRPFGNEIVTIVDAAFSSSSNTSQRGNLTFNLGKTKLAYTVGGASSSSPIIRVGSLGEQFTNSGVSFPAFVDFNSITTIEMISTLSISPDGNKLAVGTFGEQFTNSDVGIIYIYDTNTQTLIKEIIINEDNTGVSYLEFSPDGEKLAFTNFGSKKMFIYDTNTYELISTLKHPDKIDVFGILPYTRASPNIINIWSPDSTKIIVKNGKIKNSLIYVWDILSEECVIDYETNSTGEGFGIAVFPDVYNEECFKYRNNKGQEVWSSARCRVTSGSEGREQPDRTNFGLNNKPVKIGDKEYKNWKDPEYHKDLRDLMVNQSKSLTINILGYASAVGGKERNLELSKRRVEYVQNYIKENVLNGLSEDEINKRLKIVSKGEGQTSSAGDCKTSPNDVTDDGKLIDVKGSLNDTEGCKANRYVSVEFVDDIELKSEIEDEKKLDSQEGNLRVPNIPLSRFYSECDYFEKLSQDDPIVYSEIKQKIKYFQPSFHSTTPEGFNSRLNFLQQCMRQGPTKDPSKDGKSKTPENLAFGRPPVCILRLGDFYYTRIIIDSISFSYDPLVWDLNPEGIGVQPMICTVDMSFNFIGGSSLNGPISKLQNAVSFNYYANTEIYDRRSDTIGDNGDGTGYIIDGLKNINPDGSTTRPFFKPDKNQTIQTSNEQEIKSTPASGSTSGDTTTEGVINDETIFRDALDKSLFIININYDYEQPTNLAFFNGSFSLANQTFQLLSKDYDATLVLYTKNGYTDLVSFKVGGKDSDGGAPGEQLIIPGGGGFTSDSKDWETIFNDAVIDNNTGEIVFGVKINEFNIVLSDIFIKPPFDCPNEFIYKSSIQTLSLWSSIYENVCVNCFSGSTTQPPTFLNC